MGQLSVVLTLALAVGLASAQYGPIKKGPKRTTTPFPPQEPDYSGESNELDSGSLAGGYPRPGAPSAPGAPGAPGAVAPPDNSWLSGVIGANPSGPYRPQSSPTVPCTTPGHVCVPHSECQGGVTTSSASGPTQCDASSQVCCQKLQPQQYQPQPYQPQPQPYQPQPQPQPYQPRPQQQPYQPQPQPYQPQSRPAPAPVPQFRPQPQQPFQQQPQPSQPRPYQQTPIGGSIYDSQQPPQQPRPQPNYNPYVTENPIQRYTGPLNVTPHPGCPAALKCVEEIYCTWDGVMSDTPQALSRDQIEDKVPLSDCQNVETGIIGKCCRDPNYKDPWPAGMMMGPSGPGFDDGLYHPPGNHGGAAPNQGFPSQPSFSAPQPQFQQQQPQQQPQYTVNSPPFGQPAPAQPGFSARPKGTDRESCGPTASCAPQNLCPGDRLTQPGKVCRVPNDDSTGVCCTKAQYPKNTNNHQSAPPRNAYGAPIPQPRPTSAPAYNQPAPYQPQPAPQPTPYNQPAPYQPQPAPQPTPYNQPKPAPYQPKPAPQPTPYNQPAPYQPKPAPQPNPYNQPAPYQPKPAPEPVKPSPQNNPYYNAPKAQPTPYNQPAPYQPKPAPEPVKPSPQNNPYYNAPKAQPTPYNQPAPYQPKPAPQPNPYVQPAPYQPKPAPEPVKTSPQNNPYYNAPKAQPTPYNQPPPYQPIPAPEPDPFYQPQSQTSKPTPQNNPYYNAPKAQPKPQPSPYNQVSPQEKPAPNPYNLPAPQPTESQPTEATTPETTTPDPAPLTPEDKNNAPEPVKKVDRPTPGYPSPSKPESSNAVNPDEPTSASPAPKATSPPPVIRPKVASPETTEPPAAPESEPGKECGVRRKVPRPNGPAGLDTGFGEFPWQAQVLRSEDQGPLCSAAILAENIVVTAAHCVDQKTPGTIKVKAGDWKLGSENPGEEPKPIQVQGVAAIALHPQFDPITLQNDMAVLVLDSPLKFDQHVDKVCLGQQTPPGQPPAGNNCVVTGWGKDATRGNIPGSTMHSIPVSFMPNQQCQDAFKKTHLGKYFQLHSSFTCALPNSPNHDLCQVDAGSPIACQKPDGKYELSGIYSWDAGCHPNTNVPVAMSKVDNEFIASVMEKPVDEIKKEIDDKREQQSTLGQASEDVQASKPGFSQGYGR